MGLHRTYYCPSIEYQHVTSRRKFIFLGSLGAAGAILPRSSLSGLAQSTAIDTAPRVGDPLLRELAMAALDAAKSAGASYADVRLTLTRKQSFYYGNAPIDGEHLAVGVRALVDGAWGFVAGPRWTMSEMTRLGKDAAIQAKANVWDGVSKVNLGAALPAIPESWSHPVKRDPIDVPIDEKLDYIRSAEAWASTFRSGSASSIIIFERQDRTFASTEGLFGTQVLYNTFGNGSGINVSASDPVLQRNGSRSVNLITPTSAGFEVFNDGGLIDMIPVLYDQARQQLTAEQIQPSRYDIVFDGVSMTSLVDQSIGAALELDRAVGLEANAGGTSYMAPLDTVLGSELSSVKLNVIGERSSVNGAATVGWDDDGVAPKSLTYVKDGRVHDYSTNREHAELLQSWYASNNMTAGSHGCAFSETAMDFPLISPPNIRMQPDTSADRSFNDLVSSVDNGLAVIGGRCSMDHQKLTGRGSGELIYRVRNGKLAEVVRGASYLFRSPELWKALSVIGGQSSLATTGFTSNKGQPRSTTVHSVTAPAAIIKNMSVIVGGSE